MMHGPTLPPPPPNVPTRQPDFFSPPPVSSPQQPPPPPPPSTPARVENYSHQQPVFPEREVFTTHQPPTPPVYKPTSSSTRWGQQDRVSSSSSMATVASEGTAWSSNTDDDSIQLVETTQLTINSDDAAASATTTKTEGSEEEDEEEEEQEEEFTLEVDDAINDDDRNNGDDGGANGGCGSGGYSTDNGVGGTSSGSNNSNVGNANAGNANKNAGDHAHHRFRQIMPYPAGGLDVAHLFGDSGKDSNASEEFPFPCKYCPQSFANKSVRSRHHRALHPTTLRLFTCKLCGHTIIQWATNIRRHARGIHAITTKEAALATFDCEEVPNPNRNLVPSKADCLKAGASPWKTFPLPANKRLFNVAPLNFLTFQSLTAGGKRPIGRPRESF